MTQDNVNLFLSLHIKFLKYLGFWMLKNPNKFYNIYQLFGLCLHYSVILFLFIYLGCVWGDLEAISTGIYVLSTQVSTCLKVTSVVVNREEFVKVLEFMNCETFVAQTDEHRKILSVQFRKMRHFYYLLLGMVTFNIFSWFGIPLADRDAPRAYPFTMWMPGNIEKSPDYELGYLYQTVFTLSGGFSFVTMDCVVFATISFGCAQLDITKNKLRKIKSVPYSSGVTHKERNDILKENNALLTECICQHQAIIRYISSLEKFFNINIFYQLSSTVVIVCIIAFRLSLEPPNTAQFFASLNYMISQLAQLYCYCWSGNELTSRSQELRDELYLCPWHNQDAKFRRKLCFAMECMKNPLVFKAGYYISLTRPTFVTILRCSYSYFAVLNQANST